ncbi:hypothetical protein H6P81_020360 [Aristolochia fimbriata]|uniref:Uncharacterized protein n=1 Tax=Aristolochia fimbriata TaxID=158543 RepID=A0AAV7DU65_ARIFI|nr:hypothetical protein H6P81_020360 [Aristolochia fimbriata]
MLHFLCASRRRLPLFLTGATETHLTKAPETLDPIPVPYRFWRSSVSDQYLNLIRTLRQLLHKDEQNL